MDTIITKISLLRVGSHSPVAGEGTLSLYSLGGSGNQYECNEYWLLQPAKDIRKGFPFYSYRTVETLGSSGRILGDHSAAISKLPPCA